MEPGFVKIIHPGLGVGSVSEVPESSLFEWYRGGWRLLKDDEALPPPASEEVPEPVSIAEVTAAAASPDEEK